MKHRFPECAMLPSAVAIASALGLALRLSVASADAESSANQAKDVTDMDIAEEVGDHSLSVDLMGKNLLDERYRPSQSSRSRPREFMINFSVRY